MTQVGRESDFYHTVSEYHSNLPQAPGQGPYPPVALYCHTHPSNTHRAARRRGAYISRTQLIQGDRVTAALRQHTAGYPAPLGELRARVHPSPVITFTWHAPTHIITASSHACTQQQSHQQLAVVAGPSEHQPSVHRLLPTRGAARPLVWWPHPSWSASGATPTAVEGPPAPPPKQPAQPDTSSRRREAAGSTRWK